MQAAIQTNHDAINHSLMSADISDMNNGELAAMYTELEALQENSGEMAAKTISVMMEMVEDQLIINEAELAEDRIW